ncbi:MAG: class I SAM-dependent methyltransferase [Candidatus Dormibacteraceae bacterium]
MKVCLRCRSRLDGWTCASCGFEPDTSLGYPSFARAEALTSDVSKDDNFEALSRVEHRSFWFRSRNQLVIWALRAYCPTATDLLEIGCGSGYVLSGVAAALPGIRLSAVEMFAIAIAIARRRVPAATFYQADAANLPFEAEFDVVTCLDVLEHIGDDRAVLDQIVMILRSRGVLIATVPQHPWLWSGVDEYAHHKRRYRRGELEGKLTAAGFEILFSSSFVTLLLPLVLISRSRQQVAEELDPLAEFKLPPALDRLLEYFLVLERRLLGWGLRLPLGASRLVVARVAGPAARPAPPETS